MTPLSLAWKLCLGLAIASALYIHDMGQPRQAVTRTIEIGRHEAYCYAKGIYKHSMKLPSVVKYDR